MNDRIPQDVLQRQYRPEFGRLFLFTCHRWSAIVDFATPSVIVARTEEEVAERFVRITRVCRGLVAVRGFPAIGYYYRGKLFCVEVGAEVAVDGVRRLANGDPPMLWNAFLDSPPCLNGENGEHYRYVFPDARFFLNCVRIETINNLTDEEKITVSRLFPEKMAEYEPVATRNT